MTEAKNRTPEDAFTIAPTTEGVSQLLAWAKVIRDVRTRINHAHREPDVSSEALRDEYVAHEAWFAEHDLHIAAALESLAKTIEEDLVFAQKHNDHSLANLRFELRTQDNACTADPVFVVQQKNRIFGFTSDYTDHFVWLDENGDVVPPEEAVLITKCYDIPEGWHRVGYRDVYQYVMPFFTREAAQDYIDMNRHNLNEPRIYVESAYRNYEWQRVVALLLSKP